MSLDRYKIGWEELDPISWKKDMDQRFRQLPNTALFIENGIVPAFSPKYEYSLKFVDERNGEKKMHDVIEDWNKRNPDPNIQFLPGPDMYKGQNPNTYFPTFRLKGYFTNEETFEKCLEMMWEHIELEDIYVYIIKDKAPVTERIARIQNGMLNSYEHHREEARSYYKLPFEQRPSCLQIGPIAIIERPFKFPFKEIKTEEEFGTRMWMTLLNHLPGPGKENDYNALKDELYKQHSMEVVLYQAFKHVERYIKSHPTLDPLGKWRNKLDEQLTAGTAANGDLMKIFNYYAKHKDKSISDEANWDKAIEYCLPNLIQMISENEKKEYDDF